MIGLMDLGGLPYSELYPKAKSALDKALQMDDSLAEVYGIQGQFKHIAEWDWEGAEKAFQKSLELNPNLSNTYFGYSVFLISMDRRDDALAMMNKARSLDPLNVYTALGDKDEAFKWFEKSYQEHSGWSFFIKVDPMADPLRSALCSVFEKNGVGAMIGCQEMNSKAEWSETLDFLTTLPILFHKSAKNSIFEKRNEVS